MGGFWVLMGGLNKGVAQQCLERDGNFAPKYGLKT